MKLMSARGSTLWDMMQLITWMRTWSHTLKLLGDSVNDTMAYYLYIKVTEGVIRVKWKVNFPMDFKEFRK